jgi:hypothetical protein
MLEIYLHLIRLGALRFAQLAMLLIEQVFLTQRRQQRFIITLTPSIPSKMSEPIKISTNPFINVHIYCLVILINLV